MDRESRTAPPPAETGETQPLDGVVDRITYRNEENGYTVARLKVPRQKQLVTIAGHLPGISVGEGLRVHGRWSHHLQYGRQFSVAQYQSVLPGTVAALKKYLGSGLLKGVGPVMAEHIVNTFGLGTLQVLDEQPHRLAEVPGMSKRKATAIAETWNQQRALRELMVFLQEQGLQVALAVRILRKYGSASEAIVRNQPYRLAAEVYGVTFELADAMAARSGVAPNALQRIAAGLAHVLREAAASGHTYLPLDAAVTHTAKLLSLSRQEIVDALPQAQSASAVEVEMTPGGQAAYLPEMFSGEVAVSAQLVELVSEPHDRLSLFGRVDWDTAWRYLAARDTLELTDEQRQAIRIALTERVAVINGGPGTGKTTALRSIVRLVTAKQRKPVLAAPTGRAAKRLSQAAGMQASTIHRLLELKPGGSYEVRNPLDADLVIVDEASMMDLQLAEALIKAVPAGAHLLLVGDADQLPPVGPGSVFRDVIASGVVPVATLKTIFRQAEGSAIVSNAHRINAGQAPVTGRDITDFFFFSRPAPAECADLIVDLATRRVPEKFGLDPMEDIQVIAPIYGGVAGVEALNTRLQAALNPPDPVKDERRFGNRIFRVGDKVMQVVNDYERQVSNGELGRITRIDLEEQTLRVNFDSEWSVSYTFQELDELTHAYAISVHKAQGSEYPAVVMPVLAQHGRLLQRNLLYTSVSRARQLVVLVGSADALKRGVANNTATSRNSSLVDRLRHDFVAAGRA